MNIIAKTRLIFNNNELDIINIDLISTPIDIYMCVCGVHGAGHE